MSEILAYKAPILIAGFIFALLLVVKSTRKMSTGTTETSSTVASKANSAIAFSTSQLTAMRSVWQWYKTGQAPASSALAALSSVEVSDLLAKCNKVSQGSKATRDKLQTECQKLGMDDIEIEVLLAMKQGRLGPANDLN